MTNQFTGSGDEGGLSKRGASVLGFDVKCQCGHDYGLHEASDRCAVLDCQCKQFAAAGSDSACRAHGASARPAAVLPGLVRDTPSSWAAERLKEAKRNYHTVRFQHRRGMLIASYYTYDGKVHIHDRELVL